MRAVLHVLMAAGLAVALARAALFLAAAGLLVGHPLEAYHLEAKMVYLAWRAQAGLPLYPDWGSMPFESNFYGPLYFLAVGRLGDRLDLDLAGLFRVGRLLTIAAGVAAAVLVGLAAGARSGRSGRSAGLFAGLLALGSAPMAGFGAMVRPDLLADTLGLAGFLAAVGRPSSWRAALGGALLVAAVLTKQTTGLYLIAAAIALALLGRPRGAAALVAGSASALLLIAAAASATVEPHLLRSLIGDSGTPIAPREWLVTLHRLAVLAPEVPALTLLGLALWCSRSRRDVPLAALAAVLAAGSTLSALKLGSDLNYFLGLRLVAALAGGTLWGAASSATRGPAPTPPASATRPATAAAAMLAVLIVLLPSFRGAAGQFLGARALAAPHGPAIREALMTYRRLFRLAEDPDVAILTDCGLVALHQRDRAPFVDPFLFRVMVEAGRLDPEAIRRRVEAADYAMIVTTKDLFDRRDPYDTYTFGMPPALAEAARRRYRPAGSSAGLFFYTPIEPDAPDRSSP